MDSGTEIQGQESTAVASHRSRRQSEPKELSPPEEPWSPTRKHSPGPTHVLDTRARPNTENRRRDPQESLGRCPNQSRRRDRKGQEHQRTQELHGIPERDVAISRGKRQMPAVLEGLPQAVTNLEPFPVVT